MWFPIDNLPLFILIVLLFFLFYKWDKVRGRAHLVEVDYDKLSEKRRREAWERADSRGFVYLGLGRQVLTWDVSFPMTLGKETVCRVEGGELRIYEIDSAADFLNGGGNPRYYGASFRLAEIREIRVWYEPFTGYACLRIDFVNSMVSELGPDYVKFWTNRSSKRRATDALVLVYEGAVEQLKKK